MTTNRRRQILTILLITLFIFSCIIVLGAMYLTNWLATYTPFTTKQLVAEITVSEKKKDDQGSYAEVELQPMEYSSAFTQLINGPATTSQLGAPQNFQVYGDTVYLGGPIISHKPGGILGKLGHTYKLSQLSGRYKNSVEPTQVFPLLGGLDATWRGLHQSQANWPYADEIAFSQLSMPGVDFTETPQSFSLYVTPDGFVWEEN